MLVDSTSLNMLREGQWNRKMHDAEYRRQSRKLHIGIDAPVLISLLGHIDPKEAQLSVSGNVLAVPVALQPSESGGKSHGALQAQNESRQATGSRHSLSSERPALPGVARRSRQVTISASEARSKTKEGWGLAAAG